MILIFSLLTDVDDSLLEVFQPFSEASDNSSAVSEIIPYNGMVTLCVNDT